MLDLMIYLEISGQLLAVLAGIWFVRAKTGIGGYLFLIGTVMSFVGISIFSFFDTPVSGLMLDGKPSGQVIVLAVPALGQLLIGVGGCMLAYRLMRVVKREE